mmetsp:Transcript_57919/g.172874  ORF Transcript_57919/g.172874 Transcript_57919/m.172874 type:complete len:174 (-) Transcript_57919:404-925(-)
MLAPRKKLWSTPDSAICAASRLADLCETDTLYDVGCGDGRVIIDLASTSTCLNFVGIEIDPDRASEAQENVRRALEDGKIDGASRRITIECRNALEVDYSNATVVFLYLVPRGLRLIKPLMENAARCRRKVEIGRNEAVAETSSCNHPPSLRIVTYMSGFVDEKYVKKRTLHS